MWISLGFFNSIKRELQLTDIFIKKCTIKSTEILIFTHYNSILTVLFQNIVMWKKKNTEWVLLLTNLLEQNFLFLEFHDQQSWPHLTLHIQIFSKLSKGSAGGTYNLIYHRKHPCGTRNKLSTCNTAQWIKDGSQPNSYPFWQLD